jgi:small-conductance mechanosensitive channel
MDPRIQYLKPLAFIIGGFVLGLILEKVVVKRVRRMAIRTTWRYDEVIVSSLGGMIMLWFTLAGAYGALLGLPISEKILGISLKVLLVLVVSSVTIVVAKLVAGSLSLYARSTEALPSSSILTNFARALILVGGFLVILQALGISITPMITALGVGGLAVALALQDTLANLFSGIFVIASKQVAPGDWVELESGQKGYVTDVTWRNTTIKALPNNMIIVPNSKLASTIVTNFYQPVQEMSVLVEVGVSYDSDLAKVERVTAEVAKQVMTEIEGGVPEFEPFIRYHTFADFSINFTVIMRAREYVSQYLIKHEFVKRLHERYRMEDIEIPFPIRTVMLEPPERSPRAAVAG